MFRDKGLQGQWLRNGQAGRPFFRNSTGEIMADDREIEDKFWTALKGSPFLMLGV